MKKSLEDELMSLAHSILQLRGRDDVYELKNMAGALYEKLAILAFTEKHFEGPRPTIGRQDVERALVSEKSTTSFSSVGEKPAPAAQAIGKHNEEITTAKQQQEQEKETLKMDESVTTTSSSVEKEEPESVDEDTADAKEEEPNASTGDQPDEPYQQPTSPDFDTEEEESTEAVDSSKNTDSGDADFNAESVVEEDVSAESIDGAETGEEEENPTSSLGQEPVADVTADKADNLRNIAVHYDDLPDFEPINFSTEDSISKEESQSSAESSFSESTKLEEEEPDSTPDLFSTSKKVRTRNDLKPSHKSLNERLNHGLKFGLNDRLAFVNHLFNGDSADFDRVVSQLNTISTYPEAETFIKEQIKPDYNWEHEELYEERFFLAVEKRMTH